MKYPKHREKLTSIDRTHICYHSNCTRWNLSEQVHSNDTFGTQLVFDTTKMGDVGLKKKAFVDS